MKLLSFLKSFPCSPAKSLRYGWLIKLSFYKFHLRLPILYMIDRPMYTYIFDHGGSML